MFSSQCDTMTYKPSQLKHFEFYLVGKHILQKHQDQIKKITTITFIFPRHISFL